MAVRLESIRSFVSLLSLQGIRRNEGVSPKRTTATMSQVMRPTSATPEAEFLVSIAHLSPEAREIAIQKREWYQRLAERQAIADAEWRYEQYQRTGDDRYID